MCIRDRGKAGQQHRRDHADACGCEPATGDDSNGAQIKKSPGPSWNPEDCTRNIILAYSPAHEGIKGLPQAGLLAHGSSYSPRLPTHRTVNSGACGFRPHLQRRDREGFSPSSLDPRGLEKRQTLGAHGRSCQVQTCRHDVRWSSIGY